MQWRASAWLAVAALCLPLAGCWSDQQQQLAVCTAASPFSVDEKSQATAATRVVACMDKSGYQLALNNTPCGGLAGPRRQPYCYEPKDAWARLGFKVEMLFQGPPSPPTATQ